MDNAKVYCFEKEPNINEQKYYTRLQEVNRPRIYGLHKNPLSREGESRGVAKRERSHSRF